jgi:putative phosphoribosyl transferase
MLRDRRDGGRRLARELARFRGELPVVIGLARGGVPVALEVARALEAPLGVMVVQRVGADQYPEWTLAAVAEGGALYVRPQACRSTAVSDIEVVELASRTTAEVAHRTRACRGAVPNPDLAGRTVVLVDDGAATGATALAAQRSARAQGAARVVLAAPVVAALALPELESELDEVVALDWPHPFMAVGVWYERFEPTTDEEVVDCIRRGAARRPRGEGHRLWGGEPSSEPVAGPPAAPGEVLTIPCPGGPRAGLEADLVAPLGATGIVIFTTGSARESPRYRVISRELHRAGLATLRCDLLDRAERHGTGTWLPSEARLLASRIALVGRWIAAHPATRGLQRGLYTAAAGTEAALAALAVFPDLAEAIVVRAGELDLVPAPVLASVRAPVLLIAGGRDESGLSASRETLTHLAAAELAVVPGATDLFHEPGALDATARLAATWFARWLGRGVARTAAGAPGLEPGPVAGDPGT